jgi:predicted  nucleic acid-binding Zn-ribbon protein
LEVDVLGLLANLQSVADEIDRLEARRRGAREDKERAEASLRAAESALAEQEERRHNVDIERRKREMLLKAEKEKSQRVKSRLGEVKTSREYQAVLAEIGASKQTISDQEEALLKDMESLEGIEGEVGTLKGRVESLKAELEAAERQLESALAETEQATIDRKGEESDILKTLPVEVVDRYRLIRMRRGGLAVVEARDEACTACFMRIPPQTYIEVMRRSKVIQCPNCHRILIPPKAAPAEEQGA